MLSKEFYTPAEVARMTGVEVPTVYRWIRTKKLKATKLGQWKITREALEEALEKKPEGGANSEPV